MAGKAKSKSTSKATQTDAGAGTETRRTTSSAEKDTAGSTTRIDQIVDTGADEAHMASVLEQTRAWNANTKMLFDQTMKALEASGQEGASHTGGQNTIREQLLANLVGNADFAAKGYMRHLALQDRSVFTAENELEASLAAKTGVQQDAFVALLAKAIADALAAQK